MQQYRHLILITAIGGAFELFDFAIFIHFSSYLAEVFFPQESGVDGLMSVLLIFAVSYIARPLGGLIFSHFGDRIGRKRLFIVSLLCMTGATFGISILPGWTTAGSLAPILLLVLRVIQGMSVGGEVPAAYIFVAEHVDRKHRGMVTAQICAGCEIGLILGAVVGALLTTFLTQEQMLEWGWRVPFFTGCLLGVIGYELRKRTIETPVFVEMVRLMKKQRVPVFALVSNFKRQVLLGVGITAVGGAMSAVKLFLPTYLSVSDYFISNITSAFWLAALFSLVCTVMSLLLGKVSDLFGRRFMVILGASLLIPIGFLAQYLLVQEVEGSIWFFVIGLSMAYSIVLCSFACAILELFPTEVRYSGLAVSYNLGFAIFCGLGPVIQNWLLNITDMAPFYILTTGALITLVSALAASARHRESLSEI